MSLQRYDSYKDSGIEWLSEVPAHWVVTRNKDIFEERLENLEFINVPEEEQDCVEYDTSGVCTWRAPPSLGGENISSIKIHGDYIVLLTYASPGQSCSDTQWSSCQEFPTPDDINKTGPQQIKWQEVRNNYGVVPNHVVIIPVGGDNTAPAE